VDLYLDTSALPPSDRAEAIRLAAWERVMPVEIHHPDSQDVHASMAITDVGPMNVCTVASSATTLRRTSRLARSSPQPRVGIGLQVRGVSVVAQGGREAVLHPGDVAVYDTTSPYTIHSRTGIDQHFFCIPTAELALPVDAIRHVAALRFPRDDPVVELTRTYLARLAGSQMVTGPSALDALAVPSVELVRAMIASQLGDGAPKAAVLDATLDTRILQYVRTHLADPDLDARRIAKAHNISVRQLYVVLAQAGISLGDWVREQRLEGARRDLTRQRSLPISTVARRWGFVDPSHFGRAFKRAYGSTPREWRNLRDTD
jgi:AraC-like DNA-binding protein